MGGLAIDFCGIPFTWDKGRVGSNAIKERLDRALCNTAWRIMFLRAAIDHLTTANSDHCLILLDLFQNKDHRPRPFWFLAFEAYFQRGLPIYSAESVQFRMGLSMLSSNASNGEKFVWTYTSPVFPMAQERSLQKFKLPEPVLCIGGILQIELLGRVQRQEMGGLFYICVTHVQVMGRLLSPAFSVENLQPSGQFVLKRDHLAEFHFQSASSENESLAASSDDMQRRLRDFQRIVIMLQGNEVRVEEDDWDAEDEMDELEEDYIL